MVHRLLEREKIEECVRRGNPRMAGVSGTASASGSHGGGAERMDNEPGKGQVRAGRRD